MDQPAPTNLAAYFEVILSHVANGIVVQDHRGDIVYANPAAARMLGFVSPAALMAAGQSGILQHIALTDETGRPIVVRTLPGRRAIRGEAEPVKIVRTATAGPAGYRWGWVKALPIHNADGGVDYAVTVFQEITQLKNTELQLKDANRRITKLLEDTLKTIE